MRYIYINAIAFILSFIHKTNTLTLIPTNVFISTSADIMRKEFLKKKKKKNETLKLYNFNNNFLVY